MSVSNRLYKQSQRLPKYRPLPWSEYLRQVVGKDAVLWTALSLAAVSSAVLRPPAGAYADYIDVKTLACLAGLMVASGGLMLCGVFDRAASRVVERSADSRSLAAAMIYATFFSSMFITNDVALIIFVPMTLSAFERAGRDPMRAVVLQTVAANVGSMVFPMGNPQNLYLFSWYGMEASAFFRAVLPLSAAGLIFLVAVRGTIRREPLRKLSPVFPRLPGGDVALYSGLFAFAILGVFDAVHYMAVAAAAAGVMAWKGRGLIQQVDYALLLTFVGFFIFVGNISGIAAVDGAMRGFVGPRPYFAALLSSQVLSNVPAAVMLSRFTEDGYALLAGVNAGGCGTLIASMASLISYKLYVRSGGERGRFLVFFTVINGAALVVMTAAYLLFG